jgi:hypothetical protein
MFCFWRLAKYFSDDYQIFVPIFNKKNKSYNFKSPQVDPCLQFHFVCAKLCVVLFCSDTLISSDYVNFFDWQVLFKLYIIGVFISGVNGKPFWNSRHYGGVFNVQEMSPVQYRTHSQLI